MDNKKIKKAAAVADRVLPIECCKEIALHCGLKGILLLLSSNKGLRIILRSPGFWQNWMLKKCNSLAEIELAVLIACKLGLPEVLRVLLSQTEHPITTTHLHRPIRSNPFLHHVCMASMTTSCPAKVKAYAEVLDVLLCHRCDVNATDQDSAPALLLACQSGHLPLVQRLISGPSINVPGTQTIALEMADRKGRNAVHHAALAGHSDVVAVLLQHYLQHYGSTAGKAVSAGDVNNQTALHIAAAKGDVSTAKMLLEVDGIQLQTPEGAAIDFAPLLRAAVQADDVESFLAVSEAAGQVGQSPSPDLLHVAVFYKSMTFLRLVLMYKTVDINAPGQDGQTPLDIAVRRGHDRVARWLLGIKDIQVSKSDPLLLHHASSTGNAKLVKLLLPHTKSSLDAADSLGRTTLHYAAVAGHAETMQLLVEAGANVNAAATRPTKTTPLMVSCVFGHVAASTVLMNAPGLNKDQRDDNGWSPLHYVYNPPSLSAQHHELGRLLVAAGFDINARDRLGATPAYYVCTRACTPRFYDLDKIWPGAQGETAVVGGSPGAADVLRDLLAWGCDVNVSVAGVPLLALALQQQSFDIALLLLSAPGLDTSSKLAAPGGMTLLHVCATSGRADVVQAALTAGFDVNAADSNSVTPLMLACNEGDADVVEVLVAAPGVKLDLAGSTGSTAVMYAAEASCFKAVRALVDAGCDVTAVNILGQNALHKACDRGKLMCINKLITARGAGTALRQRDQRGMTPHDIVSQKQDPVLLAILDQALEEL